MSKQFVGWANVIETHKFYFTANSQEEANELCKKVAFGELNLDDLHKGDYKIKDLIIEVDEPEEVK